MKRVFLLTLLLAEMTSSASSSGAFYGKESSPQTKAVLGKICSTSSGYETIEEARFALKNALLEASKKCKPTNLAVSQSKSYDEVLGYVIKRPDGKFDISGITQGERSSVSGAKPANAVESMHTHPWYAEWKGMDTEWARLGPSGQDLQTAKEQGIPAFVLDCAEGEIYGVTPRGKALRTKCDEKSGKCIAQGMGKGWSDDFFPLPRSFDQNEMDERYQEYLSKQQKTINPNSLISPTSAQLVETPSGTVNTAPAYQTYTRDNTAMKQYMSQQLEGAYQYASGIAAEAGVGAEYQSAVAPVMSYGRSTISSIPDQQTYTVPTSSAQGGGYSSQTMDEFGKRFAEQGPCSAGLWLEANK